MLTRLRAREPSSDDDDDDDFDPRPQARSTHRLWFLRNLELPCYVCEGRGRLWMSDQLHPRGRFVRCIACKGRGKMRPRQ
jgi:hypothetical protein